MVMCINTNERKRKKQKETYALVIEYNKMRMLMNSYDGLEEGEEEEEE
jgi:hypothetical protein